MNCPDRTVEPNCHNDSCPHGWAEYAAQWEKVREARQKYARTWAYESGRERNATAALKARLKKRNNKH